MLNDHKCRVLVKISEKFTSDTNTRKQTNKQANKQIYINISA